MTTSRAGAASEFVLSLGDSELHVQVRPSTPLGQAYVHPVVPVSFQLLFMVHVFSSPEFPAPVKYMSAPLEQKVFLNSMLVPALIETPMELLLAKFPVTLLPFENCRLMPVP